VQHNVLTVCISGTSRENIYRKSAKHHSFVRKFSQIHFIEMHDLNLSFQDKFESITNLTLKLKDLGTEINKIPK